MKNIMTIFNRLTIKHLKQRTLVMYLAIQNILLALIVLVASNVILSDALVLGQLNYDHIKLFYAFCIAVLFAIPYLMVPIFLSRSINSMHNTYVIDNLVSSGVKQSDIVMASFLRGLSYVVIMISTAVPIVSISFYFGGISMSTILRVFLMVFLYSMVASSLCIYISSAVIDENLSMVISYVLNLVLLILTIFILNIIVWNYIYIAIFAIASLLITVFLLALAQNTAIFSI